MTIRAKPERRNQRALRASSGGTTLIEYACIIGAISMVFGFVAPEIVNFISALFAGIEGDLSAVADSISE